MVAVAAGVSDQAVRAAESSIEAARATNHAIALCYALSHAACPIALLLGDLVAADQLSRNAARPFDQAWTARWHGFRPFLSRECWSSSAATSPMDYGSCTMAWTNLSAKSVVLRFIHFLSRKPSAVPARSPKASG